MSNPALTTDTFRAVGRPDVTAGAMTLGGTLVKTGVLLSILIAAAALSWYVTPTSVADGDRALSFALAIGGALGGLVLAMITIFYPRVAPVTSPLYAAAEGLFLGVISSLYEQRFKGLVFQAVLLTIGVLMAMLFLYATRIIRPTRYFVLGLTAATLGIGLFYLAAMLLSVFGVRPEFFQQLIYGNGMLGIGFSLFVVGIAALNLILDFAVIEQGVAMGAPKYMEWYGGFSLLVTLVWLYLEVLRLLSKLRSR